MKVVDQSYNSESGGWEWGLLYIKVRRLVRKVELNYGRRLIWTLSELHMTSERCHLKRNRLN